MSAPAPPGSAARLVGVGPAPSPAPATLAAALAAIEAASFEHVRWGVAGFAAAVASPVDAVIVATPLGSHDGGAAHALAPVGYALWRCAGGVAAPDAALGAGPDIVAERPAGGAGEAELLSIAIAPAWRRRGVAARLLAAVVDAARAAGAGALFLEVDARNIAAARLYAAAGFDEIARRARYYRDGADAAVLRRRL